MNVMDEDRALFLVKMMASELGYSVKWLRNTHLCINDILVLEDECRDRIHCFVGINKFEMALEWLRRRM